MWLALINKAAGLTDFFFHFSIKLASYKLTDDLEKSNYVLTTLSPGIRRTVLGLEDSEQSVPRCSLSPVLCLFSQTMVLIHEMRSLSKRSSEGPIFCNCSRKGVSGIIKLNIITFYNFLAEYIHQVYQHL